MFVWRLAPIAKMTVVRRRGLVDVVSSTDNALKLF